MIIYLFWVLLLHMLQKGCCLRRVYTFSKYAAGNHSAPEETDWSSAFLYSPQVKAWTGAAVPYEQWGVYARLLGGALYCGNAYSKAYHVTKESGAASAAFLT